MSHAVSDPAITADLHRQRVARPARARCTARATFAVAVSLMAVTACSASAQSPSAPTPVASASAQPEDTLPTPPAPGVVPASVRLNELGPQNETLARRVGFWNVTETVWDKPGSAPVTTTGLVAERLMMGSLLQEIIRPPEDTARADVKRTDLLTFNRLDGRWDYVSFDTRVPVGLMPAWSSAAGDGAAIDLEFAPFALPGSGTDATGQLVRMEQIISYPNLDHDVKDQYFTLADGTGTRWLTHRYDFTRRT